MKFKIGDKVHHRGSHQNGIIISLSSSSYSDDVYAVKWEGTTAPWLCRDACFGPPVDYADFLERIKERMG